MSRELYVRKLAAIKEELPPTCHLLIVSKTRSPEDIKSYYGLGQRDFGENRVQELLEKAEALKELCPEIRWHMIGHLQSNKINALAKVPNLSAIHSVHDQELLDRLIQAQEKFLQKVDLFLQFNTSHEEEKSGFETYHSLRDAAQTALKADKFRLRGLMTMGTLRTESFEKEAGRCFQDLQVERLKLEAELGIQLESSMGMSQDYRIALQEGSNWIRLGTMMFSE